MEDKVLKEIIQTLLDNKGENITYFDVSKVNPLADYFIIVTANSNRHALSLASYVEDELEKNYIIITIN